MEDGGAKLPGRVDQTMTLQRAPWLRKSARLLVTMPLIALEPGVGPQDRRGQGQGMGESECIQARPGTHTSAPRVSPTGVCQQPRHNDQGGPHKPSPCPLTPHPLHPPFHPLPRHPPPSPGGRRARGSGGRAPPFDSKGRRGNRFQSPAAPPSANPPSPSPRNPPTHFRSGGRRSMSRA